jgi:hypothetical protein
LYWTDGPLHATAPPAPPRMPPRKSCSRQWEEGSAGRGVVRVGGTGGGAALRGRSRVNGAPIAGGVAKPFLRSSGIPTEVEAPGREPPRLQVLHRGKRRIRKVWRRLRDGFVRLDIAEEVALDYVYG